MSTARERGQRGSSPAITRHIRPRDLHTVWMEDDFQESWLSGRDLSPRGMGKVSVSAPPSATGTPRSFSRRYSGYHDQPDYTSHFMSLPAYSTACSSRSRESSPRTRMTSMVLPYVNGDLPSAPQGRHRHKSFPEFPYVHFPQHSTFPFPLPFPKRRDISPVHGVRHVPAGVNRLQVTGHRSGSGQGSEELSSVSPPSSSDDAMLSVTSKVAESGGGGCHRTGALGKEGGMEGSFSCDEGYTWHSSLTCYLCDQLYRRPRILPCGHTFCSDCLVQLKDQALHEGDKSPSGHAACLMPGRGRKTRGEGGVSSPRRTAEMAAQLVCPIPGCRHSLRLMNFGRWTIRNKTVTEAVTALRRTYENRQDACTQTDISMDSVLVTLPRSLLERVSHPGMERGGLRRSPSSSLLDGMVHRALSMDCINPHYIPHNHVSWRSFVAVLGMHVLQEMLH